MIAGFIVGFVLVLVLFFVISYNSLVKKKIVVEEAFSTMDVYLKKRFDLIPNLVETVKGYARHEKETLAQIVKLRSQDYNSMTEEEKFKNSDAISRAIPSVMALAEAYPDLKANSNFIELSRQLETVESDIANSRKYYNGAVKSYNMAVQTVPTNIIAGMFHFENKRMYEVEDTAQRQNVKVSFDD